jgi:hypothetical protein
VRGRLAPPVRRFHAIKAARCQRKTLDTPVFGCTVSGMRSTDLTPAQLEAVQKRLRTMVRYLRRLSDRMGEQGFPLEDKLFASTKNASNAVHDLSVKVHYLSCKGSVGEPKPRDKSPGS